MMWGNFIKEKRSHSKVPKKLLAVVLVTLILVSMIPLHGLMDSWEKVDPAPEYKYLYQGVTKSPRVNVDDPLNYLVVPDPLDPSGYVKAYLHQYQLVDTTTDEAFFLYCSDYTVRAIANIYYARVPLETSGLGLSSETAGKLRNILLHSDLWLTLAEIQALSTGTTAVTNFSVISAGEALAAVQYAVWKLINNPTLDFTQASAIQNSYVRAYSDFLLALPAVPAADMASIELTNIEKEKEPGADNLYSVTIYYDIVGIGADVDELQAAFSAVASYTESGATITVNPGDIHVEDGYVIINNVPFAAQLTVNLMSLRNNVRDIFLYQAMGGIDVSQTFVGVHEMNTPLETAVTIDSPGNLFNITIYKDWRTGTDASSVIVSNNAAKEYTSTFEITYASGSHFTGQKVTADVTINGNGSHTTGFIFEVGKLYKIEETSASAPDYTFIPGQAKYFRFDENGQITWTGPTGTPITGQSNRFTNVSMIQTGSVAVTKTVTNSEFMPNPDELFLFELWSGNAAPGSGGGPLGNESFGIYVGDNWVESGMTDENGMFYLKHGQTALFEGLPVGSVITATELENSGNTSRYTFDIPAGTRTITAARQDITIQNTLKLGSLVIKKSFGAGDIGWANFPGGITFNVEYPDGTKLDYTLKAGTDTYTVVYPDNSEAVFPLTAYGPMIRLDNVPVGTYVVKESAASASVAEYAITTAANDMTQQTAVTQGHISTVSVTNTYRKQEANLVLTKSLNISSTSLTEAQKAALGELTFVFTITADNDSIEPITVQLYKDMWSSDPIVLAPGNYTITETIEGDTTGVLSWVNNSITVTGEGTLIGSSFGLTMADQVDQSLTITNTYTRKSGSLTITKALEGDADAGRFAAGSFTFEVRDSAGDLVETVTLPSPNGGMSYTIPGLAPGAYTVTETTHATPANYTYVSTTGSGVTHDVTDGGAATAAITNTYSRQKGIVTFSKAVTGSDNRDASFTVTISDDGAPVISAPGVDAPGVGEFPYTITNGGTVTRAGTIANDGTITGIIRGDVIEIKDLPVGADVTVTEATNGRYTQTVSGVGGTVLASGVGFSVTVRNKSVPCYTFTNVRKTGSLVLSKSLANVNWSAFPDGIVFTITGETDNWGGGVTVSNSAGSLTLTPVTGDLKAYMLVVTSSEAITFANIPAGIYTITEEVAANAGGTSDLPGYTRTTTYSVDSGGAVSGETVIDLAVGTSTVYQGRTVQFANAYERQVGTIDITKYLENGGSDHQFTFTITFTSALTKADFNAITLSSNASNVTRQYNRGTNSTIRFNISGAGTVTLSNVPNGTTFTVGEAAHAEYTTDVSPSSSGGTVMLNETVTITFTNTRRTDASVTVTKTVAADVPDSNTVFTFIITVNGDVWANGSYTLSGVNGTQTTNAAGEFTLTHDQTATFTNIPRGATVVITETNDVNYTTSNTGSISENSGRTATVYAPSTSAAVNAPAAVTFTNTRGTGGLRVTKSVTGNAAGVMTGKVYTFILSRVDSPTDSTPMSGAPYTVSTTDSSDPDVMYTGPDGSFTLLEGETAVFADLFAGEYTVIEDAVTGVPNNIQWTKSGDGNVTVSNGGEAATLITANDYEYKTGSLAVKKIASLTNSIPGWETSPINGPFTFTLYNAATDTVVTTGFTITTDNGGATHNNTGVFQLSNGQTAMITGLNLGSYYVLETHTAPVGFALVTTYNGETDGTEASATVSSTEPGGIDVENVFTRDAGNISVKKIVTVNTLSAFPVSPPPSYTFTLYAGANHTNKVDSFSYSIDGGLAWLSASNGTFTLKADETALIKDLPTGTYYVVETEPVISGYTVNVTNGDTPVATGGKLKVTNAFTRVTGNLTISKDIGLSSFGGVPADWSFDFTIEGPADWDGSYTNKDNTTGNLSGSNGIYSITLTKASPSITLRDLPGGGYTVTETGGTQVASTRMETTVNGVPGSYKTISVGTGGTGAAAFVNTYRLIGAFLNLEKNFDGVSSPDATFAFELQRWDGDSEYTQYGAVITLDGSPDWSKLIELPAGEYRIRETSWSVPGHTFVGVTYDNGKTFDDDDHADYDPYDGGWIPFKIIDTVNISLRATNHYMKDGGILRVTKAVDGYVGGDEFVFTLQHSGGAPASGYKYYIDGMAHYTDTSGEFALKVGEIAEFRELEPGGIYTLTETRARYQTNTHDNSGNYELAGVDGARFTFTVSNTGVITRSPESADDGITLSNDDTVSFSFAAQQGGTFPGVALNVNNARLLGELTISKTIDGTADADDFTMKVTFAYNGKAANPKDFEDSIRFSTSGSVEDGYILVKVPAGGSAVISGLPYGLAYTVVEVGQVEAFIPDYSGGASGTISSYGSSSAIVNTVQYGKLSVSKYVRGAFSTDAFDIIVTLSPDNGLKFTAATLAGLGLSDPDLCAGSRLDGGKIVIELSLRNNQTMTITNIPLGTSYDIYEALPSGSGFTPLIIGGKGAIHADEESGKIKRSECVATIYNFYIPESSLLVFKDVSAAIGSPLNTKLFNYTLTLSEPGEDTGAYERKLVEQLEKAQGMRDDVNQKANTANDWLSSNPWTDQDEEDYIAAQQTLANALSNAVDVCGNCGGTGEIPHEEECPDCEGGELRTALDCTACEGDDPECVACGGTGVCETVDVCATCGGSGMITTADMDDCPVCGGSGNIPDDDAAQDARDAFNNLPIVQKYTLKLEQEDYLERATRLTTIIDKLFTGVYVEFDPVTFVEISTGPNPVVKFASLDELLDTYSISAYRLEAGGNAVPVDIRDQSGINLSYDDASGVITFHLAKGYCLLIEGLPEGMRYTLTESGYGGSGGEPHVATTVNGVSSDSITDMMTEGASHSARFLNEYEYATGSLTVTKVWPNGNGDISSVTIEVYKDSELLDTLVLNAGNEWSETLTGLALGSSYSIKEVSVPGYSVSYSAREVDLTYQSSAATITVTNMRINENNSNNRVSGRLSVVKRWPAGNGGVASVTVQIYLNGTLRNTLVLNENNDWSASLTNLPLGRYSVREVSVPGYIVDYSSTGIDLTASRTSATITITNTPDDSDIGDDDTPRTDFPDDVKLIEGFENDNNENSNNDKYIDDYDKLVIDEKVPRAEFEDIDIIPSGHLPNAAMPRTGLSGAVMLLWSFGLLAAMTAFVIVRRLINKKQRSWDA